MMSVDELYGGAAHHTDFVSNEPLSQASKTGTLILVGVSTFFCVLTFIKLARQEKQEKGH